MEELQMLFKDILQNEDFIKLLASALVGAFIGAEREYQSKSAGLRTFTLISVGSTIFTILSQKMGNGISDDRIAANIVTGIGFLGAGVIFKIDDRIKGLTTAVIIWITAALGMAIGEGNILLSFLGTFIVYFVLAVFVIIEKWMSKLGQSKSYKIVIPYSSNIYEKLNGIFKDSRVEAVQGKQNINNQILTGYWIVRGKSSKHERLVKKLLKMEHLKELEY
ncbi:MAG: MgtC/SapB family protein [Pseudarcicella sp.]|nr:MgtC/SapB family protein [Pseudarcicella sp.]MBP6409852.1 MgtC/SapB family protein [Pseudarcicella sp.]